MTQIAMASVAETAQLALATRKLLSDTHRAIESCRRATSELGEVLRSARQLTNAARAILKQHREGLVTDPRWVESYLKADSQVRNGRSAESRLEMRGWATPVFLTEDCRGVSEHA